jgi:hypothetical protein
MPSLSKKDRVSLCLFTFSDGRRCRTPRLSSHPHFCLYHAQKEAQSLAAQKLSNELAYFFSGGYLAACDLSTALSRIIPAVIRGDVKPKTARTVAYLAQTLLQSIRVSQHEYVSAYGTDFWRGAVQDSVKSGHDYLFPPKPAPPSAPPPNSTQPVSSPPTPPPITTVAPAPAPVPAPPRTPQTRPAQATDKPRPQTTSTPAPATSQSQPTPAPQPAPPAAPPPPANNPPQTTPQTPQQYFDRERGGLHFDHNYRLFVDGKPWDGQPL